MSISDGLINLICYIVQNLMLNNLPTDAPLYSLLDFKVDLQGIRTALIYCLSGWSAVAPMALILTLLRVIVVAELALFVFNGARFMINLLRGSGA